MANRKPVSQITDRGDGYWLNVQQRHVTSKFAMNPVNVERPDPRQAANPTEAKP